MSASWEQKQGELWERVFQVTQDVVALAETVPDTMGGAVCATEMVKSAMNVGKLLVRASAADNKTVFQAGLEEAKLSAIETDYWLRLLYLLQQREEVQRDLSSIINQYSAIVDLLQRLLKPTSAKASAGRPEHISRRRSA